MGELPRPSVGELEWEAVPQGFHSREHLMFSRMSYHSFLQNAGDLQGFQWSIVLHHCQHVFPDLTIPKWLHGACFGEFDGPLEQFGLPASLGHGDHITGADQPGQDILGRGDSPGFQSTLPR